MNLYIPEGLLWFGGGILFTLFLACLPGLIYLIRGDG